MSGFLKAFFFLSFLTSCFTPSAHHFFGTDNLCALPEHCSVCRPHLLKIHLVDSNLVVSWFLIHSPLSLFCESLLLRSIKWLVSQQDRVIGLLFFALPLWRASLILTVGFKSAIWWLAVRWYLVNGFPQALPQICSCTRLLHRWVSDTAVVVAVVVIPINAFGVAWKEYPSVPQTGTGSPAGCLQLVLNCTGNHVATASCCQSDDIRTY